MTEKGGGGGGGGEKKKKKKKRRRKEGNRLCIGDQPRIHPRFLFFLSLSLSLFFLRRKMRVRD